MRDYTILCNRSNRIVREYYEGNHLTIEELIKGEDGSWTASEVMLFDEEYDRLVDDIGIKS